MTSPCSATPRFPEQQVMLQYLQNHPFSQETFLTHKTVVDSVSRFFAAKNFDPEKLDLELICCLSDINDALQIPAAKICKIHLALVEALTDCANNIPVAIKNPSKL